MKKYGESIAYHRKRLNLTQTELGEQLNVTAQAVSKWENDISEPDLITVQRLCKIFGITVDEFLNKPDGEKTEAEVAAAEAVAEAEPVAEAAPAAEPAPMAAAAPVAATTAAAVAPAPAPVPAEAPAPKFIVGYCESCKRPLEQGSDYVVTSSGGRMHVQHIFCRACAEKKKQAEHSYEYNKELTNFKRSWIWGSVVAAVLIVIFLVVPIVLHENILFAGLALAVFGFMFTTQCFWGELVSDIFFFFCKSFRMPGVIFSLDLEGIIWLLTVKLFLAILSGLLSVICFLFGLAFTLVFSLFAFPFSLIAEVHKLKKLKKAI